MVLIPWCLCRKSEKTHMLFFYLAIFGMGVEYMATGSEVLISDALTNIPGCTLAEAVFAIRWVAASSGMGWTLVYILPMPLVFRAARSIAPEMSKEAACICTAAFF